MEDNLPCRITFNATRSLSFHPKERAENYATKLEFYYEAPILCLIAITIFYCRVITIEYQYYSNKMCGLVSDPWFMMLTQCFVLLGQAGLNKDIRCLVGGGDT